MALQGGIQTFGEKYGLNGRYIYRLQICCEELLYELLNHSFPNKKPVDIHLNVAYAEADRTVEIELSCGGETYNPFDQAEDGLGVTILKKMAKKINYRREDSLDRISIAL